MFLIDKNEAIQVSMRESHSTRAGTRRENSESGKWVGRDHWTSRFNFDSEVVSGFEFQKEAIFHDVTLRDGEQTPGVVLRRSEKVAIARKLDEVGVHRIEAGMPVVSQDDFAAVKEIAHLGLKAKVIAFSRLVREDIDDDLDYEVEVMRSKGTDRYLKQGQLDRTHDSD